MHRGSTLLQLSYRCDSPSRVCQEFQVRVRVATKSIVSVLECEDLVDPPRFQHVARFSKAGPVPSSAFQRSPGLGGQRADLCCHLLALVGRWRSKGPECLQFVVSCRCFTLLHSGFFTPKPQLDLLVLWRCHWLPVLLCFFHASESPPQELALLPLLVRSR